MTVKGKRHKTAITPVRAHDFPGWYQAVIVAAGMAEPSSVRGFPIILPLGYSLWQNMQKRLEAEFKRTGHQTLYFPLFVPLGAMEQEAEHVAGFAKECAVVTHRRLSVKEGKLSPDAPLEEPLVVRPTSEAIIGPAFARWVQSYRDLPLLMNQWANVVRWEKRTRLFLRTSEFLWQEGHTAHATKEEAEQEARQMLMIYNDFLTDYLAIPVLVGTKTQSERFPGAQCTYCIEAMMQDKKALQAGTSHDLGQNFARAFNIEFSDKQGNKAFAWTTSWGVSTRLIGGLIMVHGDDDGLVLPPAIAPIQVVILPLVHVAQDYEAILAAAQALASGLRGCFFRGVALEVHIDQRDRRAGEKAWHWVKKGVPIRIELGKRELDSGMVTVSRRDQPYHERQLMAQQVLLADVVGLLEAQHKVYYDRAVAFQQAHTHDFTSKEDFLAFCAVPEGVAPGFARFYWHEDSEIEAMLQKKYKMTMRCFLLDDDFGPCIFSGKKGRRVICAKAY
jgi:prolyl-tRNA synthetase